MLRIHFTDQDLARTTIAGEPDPVWEVLLSLRALQSRDPGPALTGWHRHTRRVAPRVETRLLAELAPSEPETYRRLSDAVAPMRGAPPATADRTAVRRIGTAVDRYHQVALAPYWASIRRCVAADRAHRAEQLVGHGMAAVLSNLHPRVRWEAPVLTVLDLADADLYLDGSGLTLQPSYFCPDAPAQLRATGLPPTLVYPVPRGPGSLQQSAGEDTADVTRPVAALVGRTRTQALLATTAGCTTSQLAEVCDISLAAASHHATVLREAGLIASRRNGRAVLHEITYLGLHPLSGRPSAAAG